MRPIDVRLKNDWSRVRRGCIRDAAGSFYLGSAGEAVIFRESRR